MNQEIRQKVEELQKLLQEETDVPYAEFVRNALSGNSGQLEQFLLSNELWGGAGSIRDQAFHDSPRLRNKLLRLLIHLGELQMAGGLEHPKTESLVATYKQWEADGVI